MANGRSRTIRIVACVKISGCGYPYKVSRLTPVPHNRYGFVSFLSSLPSVSIVSYLPAVSRGKQLTLVHNEEVKKSMSNSLNGCYPGHVAVEQIESGKAPSCCPDEDVVAARKEPE